MVNPQTLEKVRRDHHAIIEALRQCDQERLVALCRDHLLPSRDAYMEQQRRLAPFAARANVTTTPAHPPSRGRSAS
jgi:DNA-binding GntR family transcriptional regulator